MNSDTIPADVEREWRRLIEKDDRTSPEEYPDMALITREELAEIMASRPAPGGEWVTVPREPTEAMLAAGEATFVSGRTGTPVGSPDDVWAAMIAAALPGMEVREPDSGTIRPDAAIAWLNELAALYERQAASTKEDSEHWSKVANAATARRIAALVASPALVDPLAPGERVEAARRKGMEQRRAFFTFDEKAAAEFGHNLYYFAPTDRAPGPYREQRHVEAIIDIASDGTLAGVELIDNMPALEPHSPNSGEV